MRARGNGLPLRRRPRDVPDEEGDSELREAAPGALGRYRPRFGGAAPEEEDENFDFEEALREIHVELEDLNTEAVRLAAVIKKNFEELGI